VKSSGGTAAGLPEGSAVDFNLSTHYSGSPPATCAVIKCFADLKSWGRHGGMAFRRRWKGVWNYAAKSCRPHPSQPKANADVPAKDRFQIDQMDRKSPSEQLKKSL
jgi:hypothetical protein